MAAADSLAATVGAGAACRALGVRRAALCRRHQPRPPASLRPQARPAWALSPPERQAVLDALHAERFADRRPAMTIRPVALLLADPGLLRSHSGPRVSNDNPFSEAKFRTLKYLPDFPERFGRIEDARAFCRHFFPWHNTEHHHTGLGLLTPAMVHYDQRPEVTAQRRAALAAAYQAPPERFARPSVDTPLAGFAGGWPHRPDGRTASPAALR